MSLGSSSSRIVVTKVCSVHIEVEGEEVTTLAWKRVLSREVSDAMRKERITESEMAKRMRTSRGQLERLLDPENPHILLETVQEATTAVGKRLTIGLTYAPRAA